MTDNNQTHNVVVTRVFNAPLEQVWRAWSEAEYVQQWWGPTGFTCPFGEMDFREGGNGGCYLVSAKSERMERVEANRLPRFDPYM